MLQHHGGIYFTNASHVTAAYFTICNMSMQFCVIYNLFSNVLAIVSPRHNFFSPCVSKSPTAPLSEPCEIQIFSGVGRVGNRLSHFMHKIVFNTNNNMFICLHTKDTYTHNLQVYRRYVNFQTISQRSGQNWLAKNELFVNLRFTLLPTAKTAILRANIGLVRFTSLSVLQNLYFIFHIKI